jgi:hypothetical protein
MPVRQIASAIDYLVWMPLALGVSLFVTLLAYGFLITLFEPFPKGAAHLLTSALLVAWPVWVLMVAWNTGNEASTQTRVIVGVAFAVPTMIVLVVALNLINGCSTGQGFPLGGSGYCR